MAMTASITSNSMSENASSFLLILLPSKIPGGHGHGLPQPTQLLLLRRKVVSDPLGDPPKNLRIPETH
jgi:hypothetical protein